MNTRIRKLRKELGLSQRELAEKIGLEKNGATVTDQNIKAICSQCKVNETWLRTGSGSMFLEEDRKFEEFFTIFQALSPVLQDYLIQTAKELLHAQSILLPDKNDQNQPD